MRKMLVFVVVFAVLALARTASAQRVGYIPQTPEGWYYRVVGDQVQMLTADNLGMVRGLTDQLRRSNIRSLTDDLRWNGVAYGIQTAGGFYPMYDRNRKPMSRRKASIIYGAAGAGIGAAVGAYGGIGGRRNTIAGAISGGVIGGVIGAMTHRRPNDDVVVTHPQGQQGVYVGRDRIPVAIGTRPNSQGPVSTPPTAGEWRVANRTSKRAELWDGERFIARIEPWQSVQVYAPENGFKAVLLIPNRSGGLDQETAQIRSGKNFNGWDIIAPAVQ